MNSGSTLLTHNNPCPFYKKNVRNRVIMTILPSVDLLWLSTSGERDILILVRILLESSCTFFSAQYLVKQWLNSYQIFMEI